MEIVFAVLSLIWVIYIFLLTGYDRSISDTLYRLKHSISINKDGVLELGQIASFKHMGVVEIFDYAEVIDKKSSQGVHIEKFKKQFDLVNPLKIILEINLFLLTFHALLGFLDLLYFNSHIVVSLFLGFFFYWKYNQFHSIKFAGFKKSNED